MTTEDAAVIWHRAGENFVAWIDTVIAEARTGKHLGGARRRGDVPGARWVTRAGPVD